LLETVADEFTVNIEGSDGRPTERVNWRDFLSETKRRLEISIDLDEIFEKCYDWMYFCNMKSFKELFKRESEDINWNTFKDCIQRTGATLDVQKLYIIFKAFSAEQSHGYFLDFD